jgi:hypothetical protein
VILGLLLTAALAIGQADTPAPGALAADSKEASAPAEPLVIAAPFGGLAPAVLSPAAVAPVPAADRWLLMKTLQGTWEGSLLDENRMAVYGWTDLSFTASSDRSSNLPIGFNYLANQFAVQQNWLRVERTVVTSGTTEPTFGFPTTGSCRESTTGLRSRAGSSAAN